MLKYFIKKIIGSRNDRVIKRLGKKVALINQLETEISVLTDAELCNKTQDFRQRYQQGETLDELLPEAFAVVREAGKRVLNMRHFDVQLIGGMVLHEGKIAEMRTGEGKTLVATLPAYLNALTGKAVHIVTVNDYLARRDAEWMGKIYTFLGMSVGVIVSGHMPASEKKLAYAADITYGTNNEYGFDYLRDNMTFHHEDRVQRGLAFAIVDEVDSILIDEARTPLIISGPTNDNSENYIKINKIVPKLTKQQVEEGEGDFSLDEKSRQAYLTEAGHERVEDLLVKQGILKEGESLYDPANIALMHHIDAALRAHFLFQRDVHYVVEDDEIVIVDEFTGRKMPGRRWSEGLHQAIEAKEGVLIQNENQTLASITFQNYFRLYEKLSGMTGTADTEAYEFQEIYGLEVVVIPTNLPMIRDDQVDRVFLTQEEKYQAIIEDIKDCTKRQQPVLVGTASIEASEYLSGLLRKAGIKHEVLNAKQHQREADIVAQAGRPGAVTIATNMAGRGTDIVLGGSLDVELAANQSADSVELGKIRQAWQVRHKQVVECGGLRIIGTERHESRRIDNQLRGRAGRQGDPGSTRFYLSLQDNLMRIFASDRMSAIMQKLGMEKGEAIEHPWVSKAIENAQRKVEAHNFDMRKHILEYDDVANDQRKVIYAQRSDVMQSNDMSDTIKELRYEAIDRLISTYIPPGSFEEQWDCKGLSEAFEHDFSIKANVQAWLDEDENLYEETLRKRIEQLIEEHYQRKVSQIGDVAMRKVEKEIMLMVLDKHWKEHLATMDYLRQSIGLRGYANKNPKQEYKRESFVLFSEMLEGIKQEVTRVLMRLQISTSENIETIHQSAQQPKNLNFSHPQPGDVLSNNPNGSQQTDRQQAQNITQPYVRKTKKIGRNDPCFCGSGKKYKQCHGRL